MHANTNHSLTWIQAMRNSPALCGVIVVSLLLLPWLHSFAAEGAPSGDPDGPTAIAANPVWAEGFQAGKLFDNINGTAVNAFNFNFVMSFSNGVGLTYPENAGMTLQDNRYYNSQIGRWTYVYCHYREFYRIRRENPMGLGWDFGFGRIIRTHNSDKRSSCSESLPPADSPRTQYVWTYVSPNGARHTLELYDSGTDEYRTHDGSYLRATQVRDGQGVISGWVLEHPDGTVFEMNHQVGDAENGVWKHDFSRLETTFNPDNDGCTWSCNEGDCPTQN